MENSFELYFNKLDELDELDKKIKTYTCCDDSNNHMITDGMMICKVCNVIINNIIDAPEWRNYKNSNSNPTRCGMPTNELLPESSLGTNILVRGNNEKMNKINRYQKWNSMPYKERSLYKVHKDIEQKCIDGGLNNCINKTAQGFYTIISQTKISRGKNRIGIIAACIYHACKEHKVPRSINELSSLFNIDSKIMNKGCKNFLEIMRMSKTERKQAIEHNRKLGISFDNSPEINGGVKIEPLPDSDSQIINFDSEDKDWNEFKIR